MASTAQNKDGSYLLSIGSAVGGITCLIVTGLILKHFGESLGATDSGRILLGAASVLVHVIGLVLMGLAFGHFCKVRNWYWAPVVLLIMLGAGGYTITSIMGFVATERISVAQSREDAAKAKRKRETDAAEAAKKRQEAQERLAKSQLGFMQAEVKDASGRERRVLQKNFAGDAAKLIAEVGKEPANEQKAASGEIAMRPDAQSEQIAEMTGASVSVVQLTLMAWIAIMMVALEIVLWPLSSFTWPRKIAVELIEDKREEAIAVGTEVCPPLVLTPEPKALPAPLIAELAAVRVSAPDPIPALEPETVAIPHRLILLPGADLWLKAMKFELLPPRPGAPGAWPNAKHAAGCFACWLQAHGQEGPFSHNQIVDLWERCCTAYHRQRLAWNVFKPEIERLKGRPIVDKKIRIDGQESPRPTRWYIASAAREIKKFEAKPDPKQEAAPDPGHRPLASLPVAAANDNRKRTVPAWIDMQRLEARDHKAMMQQQWNRSRKQRGARVGRQARAA